MPTNKTTSPKPQPSDDQHKVRHELSHLFTQTIPKILNYFVLVLSLGLIAFISWDTYKDQSFLENTIYMQYQFAVCMVFIAEYLYRFIISKHKILFFFLAMPFLLICVPYLNLIDMANLQVDQETFNILRFIPVIRGLVALVMVTNYVSRNLTTTLFASYVVVLVPIVYMCGLILFIAERNVNSAVKNMWYALWWAGMDVTTIGCYINPVTATGMVISFLLSLLGIVMLPLFTVYCGAVISNHSRNIKPTPASLNTTQSNSGETQAG